MNKAVQVVLLNDEGQILGVSRKDNHSDFGLVGGKVDPEDNDDTEAAIKREAKEETGLDIFDLKLLDTREYGGRMQYTYLGKYKGEISTTEPHVVKWTTFKELADGSFGDFNSNIFNLLSNLK